MVVSVQYLCFFVHCNPITPVAEHFISRWRNNPCTEHPIRFKPEGNLSACWVVGCCYCSYRKLIPVSYITMVLSSFAKLSQNSSTAENDLWSPYHACTYTSNGATLFYTTCTHPTHCHPSGCSSVITGQADSELLLFLSHIPGMPTAEHQAESSVKLRSGYTSGGSAVNRCPMNDDDHVFL